MQARKPIAAFRKTAGRLRTAVAWGVVGWLAVIAGLGHGLHVLGGLSHSIVPAERDFASVFSPAPDQSARVVDSQPSTVQNSERSEDCDDDACPVCHYFAHGKSTLPQAIALVADVPVTCFAATDDVFFAQHEGPAFFARGPPQG